MLPSLGVYGPGVTEPSGVASYSALIERYLASHFQVVHVSNADWKHPGQFSQVLYHIGASARHGCAFSALRERPGPAIIHEPNCLSYYYESWDVISAQERAAVLELFDRYFDKTFTSLPEVFAFIEAQTTSDRWSIDVASEQLWLPSVTQAVVHSRHVADRLSRVWSTPVTVLSQPVLPLSPAAGRDIRLRLGIEPDAFVVGSFGFIGEYKRLESVLAAWEQWLTRPKRARLLLVGQKQYGIQIPAAGDIVHLEDANDEDFDACLSAADISIQLRHPTLGETSHVVSKLLASRRHIIVSDTPFTQEYPDELVVRVRPDEHEVVGLIRALDAHAMRAEATAGDRDVDYDDAYSPLVFASALREQLLT